MLFAVRFTDKTTMRHVRTVYMGGPYRLRVRLRVAGSAPDTNQVAGSLRQEASDRPMGDLWIIEAKDSAEVENLWQNRSFLGSRHA
ncbi:hypothetical protein ACO0LG_05095 [Undibacterium sp. Ji42W]|uniref:hypothetical protein n=1 Tax=Undibacterium sp. Ji42W TaxID=3413039 RepID=UPI003BF0BCD3